MDLPISVNLSPRQFQESGLSAQAAAALDAAGLPSDLLIFEITENVVMEDLAGAREVMRKLDQLGIRLAIDDRAGFLFLAAASRRGIRRTAHPSFRVYLGQRPASPSKAETSSS